MLLREGGCPLATWGKVAHAESRGVQNPPCHLALPRALSPPALMILIPDTVLQRATSIVLVLYVGAFFGQAFCALHASHVESRMGAGMDRPAAHASASMAERSPSPHGEHSGPPGKNHSGACALVACAPAITATCEHGLGPIDRVPIAQVAYLGGMMPPDAEMLPPPPRLG